jgi:hypothetical protein
MANVLYDTGRNAFLTAAINWPSDNVKAILIDTTKYTANTATDQFLSTISGISGAIIATSANLTTKTATAGVANADNVTFPAVPTGPAAGALVLYKDTGTAGTSQLIARIDTATGLPVTPNGGDIQIAWDTGTNKIFKL